MILYAIIFSYVKMRHNLIYECWAKILINSSYINGSIFVFWYKAFILKRVNMNNAYLRSITWNKCWYLDSTYRVWWFRTLLHVIDIRVASSFQMSFYTSNHVSTTTNVMVRWPNYPFCWFKIYNVYSVSLIFLHWLREK